MSEAIKQLIKQAHQEPITKNVLPWVKDRLEKGAPEGHEFYGNQHTGGGGANNDTTGQQIKGGEKGTTYPYSDEQDKQSLISSAHSALINDGYAKGKTTSRDVGRGPLAGEVRTTEYSHRNGASARLIVSSGKGRGENFVRTDKNHKGVAEAKKK